MRKIMFNDKYGLTEAVINGDKTQTRRIAHTGEINNPKTGWLLEGKDKDKLTLMDGSFGVATSTYAVGEVVAIAMNYSCALGYLLDDDRKTQEILKLRIKNVPAFSNKMFVKSELMPCHIRITNIRCERLHDISMDDCIKEGIVEKEPFYCIPKVAGGFNDPRMAFETLIDKVSGKGTWESNPWVFVYEFEFVD